MRPLNGAMKDGSRYIDEDIMVLHLQALGSAWLQLVKIMPGCFTTGDARTEILYYQGQIAGGVGKGRDLGTADDWIPFVSRIHP